jgi:hypothetical protein
MKKFKTVKQIYLDHARVETFVCYCVLAFGLGILTIIILAYLGVI